MDLELFEQQFQVDTAVTRTAAVTRTVAVTRAAAVPLAAVAHAAVVAAAAEHLQLMRLYFS